MKISAEEFSHEITEKVRMRMCSKKESAETYISSKGEMKTSLRLMIW
jgi:hypothetical protein